MFLSFFLEFHDFHEDRFREFRGPGGPGGPPFEHRPREIREGGVVIEGPMDPRDRPGPGMEQRDPRMRGEMRGPEDPRGQPGPRGPMEPRGPLDARGPPDSREPWAPPDRRVPIDPRGGPGGPRGTYQYILYLCMPLLFFC